MNIKLAEIVRVTVTRRAAVANVIGHHVVHAVVAVQIVNRRFKSLAREAR